MAPLRNGPRITYETAYTFEEAYNTLVECYDIVPNPSAALKSLNVLPDRIIRFSWTEEQLNRADERTLHKFLEACRVDCDFHGIPVVYSANHDKLSRGEKSRKRKRLSPDWFGSQDYFDSRSLMLQKIAEDGLTEWMLRGRTNDTRACLWCGQVFRMDRSNALFDQVSCRVAFHRARDTAAHAVQSGNIFLGMFMCVDCKKIHLINAFSGLTSTKEGDVYIGGVKGRAICLGCASEKHPEWRRYFVSRQESP